MIICSFTFPSSAGVLRLNRGSTELDLYAGFRPTVGKISFDLGAWYYYYPGGQCFNSLLDANGQTFGGDCYLNGVMPISGNVSKARASYIEYFAKVAWTPNDGFGLGGGVYYDPNWAQTGANGFYAAGNIKVSAPSAWMPKGANLYVSAEVGRYWFGVTDLFILHGWDRHRANSNAGFPAGWSVRRSSSAPHSRSRRSIHTACHFRIIRPGISASA